MVITVHLDVGVLWTDGLSSLKRRCLQDICKVWVGNHADIFWHFLVVMGIRTLWHRDGWERFAVEGDTFGFRNIAM